MRLESFVNSLAWMMSQNFVVTAAMIPFVALLCRAFRHRPAVQNLLWVLVLVKFVTPPLTYLSWQLPDVVRDTMTMFAGANEQPVVDLLLADESLEPIAESLPVPIHSPAVSVPAENSRNAEARFRDFVPYAVGGAWLIGAVVLLTIQASRIGRRYTLVRRGVAASDTLARLVTDVARRLGLRGLSTLIVQGIASPFLCCLGRIRLAWPESLAHAENASVRAIVAHEAAHLRRGDHWVAWLELIASAIWWWNPLFWFARRQLHVTAEMSCDALALATFPEDRCVYAETLLWLSARLKTGAPPLVLAVSGGTPSSLERRMTMIVSERVSGKVSVWGWMFAGLLAVAAAPAWSVAQTEDPQPRRVQVREVIPRDQPARIESVKPSRTLRDLASELKKLSEADEPNSEAIRNVLSELNRVTQATGQEEVINPLIILKDARLWESKPEDIAGRLTTESKTGVWDKAVKADSDNKDTGGLKANQRTVTGRRTANQEGGMGRSNANPETGAGTTAESKLLRELRDTVRKQSVELQELRQSIKRLESRGEPRGRGANRLEQPSGASGGGGTPSPTGGTGFSPAETGGFGGGVPAPGGAGKGSLAAPGGPVFGEPFNSGGAGSGGGVPAPGGGSDAPGGGGGVPAPGVGGGAAPGGGVGVPGLSPSKN